MREEVELDDMLEVFVVSVWMVTGSVAIACMFTRLVIDFPIAIRWEMFSFVFMCT